MMALFGKMFDLNRDGRVDFAESILELGLVHEILEEEERMRRSMEEEELLAQGVDEYIGNEYEYYDSIDEYARVDFDHDEW